MPYRNHQLQHLQSPTTLACHPSPQNPQGIKSQNSPPNCDSLLTGRKTLFQVSTTVGISLKITHNYAASGPAIPWLYTTKQNPSRTSWCILAKPNQHLYILLSTNLVSDSHWHLCDQYTTLSQPTSPPNRHAPFDKGIKIN